MSVTSEDLVQRTVAVHHNPICREFAARLKKQGKSKLAIIGAVMNKLLRILFGVLKHQKPFNPNQLKIA